VIYVIDGGAADNLALCYLIEKLRAIDSGISAHSVHVCDRRSAAAQTCR
jgi:hypothetical protein